MTRALLGAFALAIVACNAPPDERCAKICQRQAECRAGDEPNSQFDKTECVAACSSMSKDEYGKQIVERVEKCSMQNLSCDRVIECSEEHTLPKLSTACRDFCEQKALCEAGGKIPAKRDVDTCQTECIQKSQRANLRVELKRDFDCIAIEDCEAFQQCVAQ